MTLKQTLNKKIISEYKNMKITQELALDTDFEKSQELRDKKEQISKKYEFLRKLSKEINKKEEVDLNGK